MREYQSLSHVRWGCKYHIVFVRNYSGTQLIDITCDFFDDLVIPEFLQT